ncbi:N-acetylmuramic acid 6-phosphate etherase [Halonatronum saccharophilum]|uniref:N-acetylmuramic acid 6-phosphate etherase n=1 Tax=Halonatronum saccharophilum TaxID=150060 RepID=UPI0004821272|nr:N-acetylmuramic acid 6-phosphate etherase [Halonatronum saccharophilum]
MECKLEDLVTEVKNSNTEDIDERSAVDIVRLINGEDQKVALAVQKEIAQIGKAVEAIVKVLKEGGCLVYIGAGTSGRLGILDAAECPPTFGTSPDKVIGIIAGGKEAMVDAVEGAEDSYDLGKRDLKEIDFGSKDIVVGIAASGRTPYVIGALEYAKSIRATTVALSCNQNSKISQIADIPISPVVGPEVITGSTRLKSGTAQKMVLNMLSTASMIKLGKVYKNLMVDVQPTNQKLVERAKSIVMQATGVDYSIAHKALKAANYNPKIAIVMIKGNFSYKKAVNKLEEADGFVRKAIN